MKKTILFFGIVAGIFTANAQKVNTTEGPASGDVTLQVNLHPLQSITINPSQKTVKLDYIKSSDYLGGVDTTEENHLEVFSTGGFDVNVKANSTALTGPGTEIALGDIKILATQGGTATTSNPLIGFTGSEVTLSGTDQVIGGSDQAGSGNIDVNYKAAGNNAYLSRVIDGKISTYTASLTYSIITK